MTRWSRPTLLASAADATREPRAHDARAVRAAERADGAATRRCRSEGGPPHVGWREYVWGMYWLRRARAAA